MEILKQMKKEQTESVFASSFATAHHTTQEVQTPTQRTESLRSKDPDTDLAEEVGDSIIDKLRSTRRGYV